MALPWCYETHPLALLSKVKKPNTIGDNYSPKTLPIKVRSALCCTVTQRGRAQYSNTSEGGSVSMCGVPPLSKPHWHTQPHTNQHRWQDNASSQPLVHSFDLSMHHINYVWSQSRKTGIRRRDHQKTGGSLPPLSLSLSDTAYGQTHFSPNRHYTNDRDTTPTAKSCTLGHLKQGYPEFVAMVMKSLMVEQ